MKADADEQANTRVGECHTLCGDMAKMAAEDQFRLVALRCTGKKRETTSFSESGEMAIERCKSVKQNKY